ncbi:MAG TPA: ABC transporter permease [Candidatus Binatia bacterium]|nr:ABC transporter permease [Candidatus Binatia bacterium]
MVDIARKNLLHDRVRFLITVVGVTFSVVLIFSQFGIYLGFMQNASIIIDNTDVDIWITSKNSANFDFPQGFTEARLNKVKEVPGVAWADLMILGWAGMRLKNGGAENIELVGFNPDTGVGGPWELVEGSVQALKAGPAVIVDESAFRKLGPLRVGDLLEIVETRVKVVGISRGVRGLTTAPYIFTSYRTAQQIIPWLREQTVFIVARVAPGHDPHEVVSRLRRIPHVDVYTKEQYSLKTRMYWTVETGLGMGFGLTVLMGVVVGMMIVGQTIYTSTIEHLREYGTLKAMGATNRDIYAIVLRQAAIHAALGYVFGVAVTLLVSRTIDATGLVMVVPAWLLGTVLVVTVAMCLGASVISVRRAVNVDPLVVFRA